MEERSNRFLEKINPKAFSSAATEDLEHYCLLSLSPSFQVRRQFCNHDALAASQ